MNAPPLRVLHVGPVPAVPAGGIAAYLLGLLRAPWPPGVTFRTVNTFPPAWAQRVRVLRLVYSAGLVARLVLAVYVWRPAVVHVHSSDFTGFWEKGMLVWLCRAAGRRTVLHLHGGSFESFLNGLGPRESQWAQHIFARTDRIVVLSRAWCPAVARLAPRDKLDVVPNAIDTAAFAPPTPAPARDPQRILFLGMISERKGMQELLEALLDLRDLPWTVEMIGGEEGHGELARWQTAYRAAGLGDRVRFRGPLYGAEKLRALHTAGVFVLPSRSESFGIANLEAMAAGMAVISTRVGAIPEYIEHGVQGLLVPPGDAGALAAALRLMLTDAGLRARCAAAARGRAQDFDWARIAPRLLDVYYLALRT